MNGELKGYLKMETIVAAAFNFFINGMIAALIYHKADYVATDVISIAIDLICTCLFIFLITAFFCRASVKRTKTEGILPTNSRIVRFLSKLFRLPVLFSIVMGLAAAIILSILIAPLFALFKIYAIPFGAYIALKSVFASLFGGGVTLLELYLGMCKTGE